MTAPANTDDREAIRQLVKDIRHAWRSGHTDHLNRYFHDDMVIVAPGFAQRCEGLRRSHHQPDRRAVDRNRFRC